MTEGAIRGKVARILNSRELAINVGSEDGVGVGMYFDVLDPKGEDIKDPDSGKILGSVYRPKVRVRVIKIQDHLSVASTYKARKINVGGHGPDLGLKSTLSDFFMPPKYVTEYETLRTDEKTWEDLDEQQSYVKTGDPVVQVVAELDVGQNGSTS